LEEALEAELKADNAPEEEMITDQQEAGETTTNTAEVMDTSL